MRSKMTRRLNNWYERLQDAGSDPRTERGERFIDPWGGVCRHCVLDECVGEDNRRCLIAIARRHELSAAEAEPLAMITDYRECGPEYYTKMVIQTQARKVCLNQMKERGNGNVCSVV